MKILFLISSFFLVITQSMAQYDEPKYALSTSYFSSENQLAIAMRCDKGIDSILLVIDTTKIKMHIKKYNSKGIESLDNIVNYQILFTPLYSGKYKIPNGFIWSNNNSFPMIFKDSINLNKAKPIKKIAKTDSIKVTNQKRNENTFKREDYKKEKKDKINSRLKNNKNTPEIIAWTDKKIAYP